MKKVISVLMVLAIIIFPGITKWQRTHRDNLVVTCLDVSHGQAVLVELPGKTNCLFDAGSLYIGNTGERIVSSFLDYKGISRLDYVVISHNDIDHLNGIPEIVENCSIGGVYANDAFFSKTDQRNTAKFLSTFLNKKGLTIQPITEDLKTSSIATIKILWPNEQICSVDELGDNDKSMVTLIEFAGAGILLCSDIEKLAQKELLRLYPDLKPTAVIVPHHGSVVTLETDFLKKLDASVLIYSCGRRQYEKQQNIEQTEKANSFYTYRDGAVTVSVDKNGAVRTETFAKTKK